MTEEWLDFIILNRNNGKHDYDYVEGPMADDQVYAFVSSLLKEEMSREEFWVKADFRYTTHQTMMRNDAIYCLNFINSYEVENYENRYR